VQRALTIDVSVQPTVDKRINNARHYVTTVSFGGRRRWFPLVTLFMFVDLMEILPRSKRGECLGYNLQATCGRHHANVCEFVVFLLISFIVRAIHKPMRSVKHKSRRSNVKNHIVVHSGGRRSQTPPSSAKRVVLFGIFALFVLFCKDKDERP